jgi:hypothetical protein
MRFVLIAVLVYLAYQFIFNFLIPVFIAARRIRKGFREMSAGMNHSGSNNQTQASYSSAKHGSAQNSTGRLVSEDDYLDFEAIK